MGLDYLGDRARFSLDVYSSVNKIDGGSPGMFNFLGNKAIPGVGDLLDPGKGHTNMFRGTHGEYYSSGLLARTEFDFNENWQGYPGGPAAPRPKARACCSAPAPSSPVHTAPRAAPSAQRSYKVRGPVPAPAEAGVIGKFATGSVQHRLQLSANILRHKEGTYNTACAYCYTTNMYDPVTPGLPRCTGLGRLHHRRNEFRSLAVADTMGALPTTRCN